MTETKKFAVSRRNFLASTTGAATAVALGGTSQAAANQNPSDAIAYEITYSDEEWREMLSAQEYAILRDGKTEKPKSSPLWEETAEGFYHCRGCDLCSYDGRWKTILDKGWVFFFHSEPDAVLTSIEGAVPEYGDMVSSQFSVTELHCRRCGSHLGHYVYIAGRMTHCINGAALTFKPTAA